MSHQLMTPRDKLINSERQARNWGCSVSSARKRIRPRTARDKDTPSSPAHPTHIDIGSVRLASSRGTATPFAFTDQVRQLILQRCCGSSQRIKGNPMKCRPPRIPPRNGRKSGKRKKREERIRPTVECSAHAQQHSKQSTEITDPTLKPTNLEAPDCRQGKAKRVLQTKRIQGDHNCS